ncbi:tail fiber assembly protein [Escherichia coli]|nr:tail fiber assembly protein [Escherichia coli]MDK8069543.1 tail fiber assembly protein [Escherichia coli]HAO1004823.1 tail fiber assembly protein [Escherichia coli]
MDITYKFANGVFYPSDIEYKSIPEHAIDVPPEEYAKAMKRQKGYDFSVDENGKVTLFEPVISEDELRLQAESQRALLRQDAEREIEWRQYAVESGKATAEEAADLIKWQDYRLELMRVNISKPVWPTMP